jgi:methionine-rich copper-binding protein CopC
MSRASSSPVCRPARGLAPLTARRRARAAVVVAALGLGAAGVLALTPAAPASAHDYVLSSTPAEGSTQTAELTEASVTFNDVILDLSGTGASNVLEVTDASGRHFEDGCSTTSGPTLSTGVALGTAGDYTLTYQAVSADGHTVSRSLPFTWTPPAGAAVAEGAATRPVCDPAAGDDDGDATATGEASSSTQPAEGSATDAASSPATSAQPSGEMTTQGVATSADDDDSNLGLVVGIGVGIVVLALVAVVVVLVTSRRRGDDLAGPAGETEADQAAAAPGTDGPG